MLLTASFPSSHPFKKLISLCRDIRPEVNFHCSPQGVTVQGISICQTVLGHIFLPSEGFDEYSCAENGTTLGVDLVFLSHVLKPADGDTRVHISCNSIGDGLLIRLESETSKRIIQSYTLRLMTIDSPCLNTTGHDMDAKVEMDAEMLASAIKNLAVFGESVEVEISKECLTLSSNGPAGNGKVQIFAGEMEPGLPKVEISIETEIQAYLSMKSLQSIIKATISGGTVTIRTKDDGPFIFEYPMGKGGEIHYCVAPKTKERYEL